MRRISNCNSSRRRRSSAPSGSSINTRLGSNTSLPGDGDALLLAAGKLSLAPVLETFEENDLKRLSDALDPAFHGATLACPRLVVQRLS